MSPPSAISFPTPVDWEARISRAAEEIERTRKTRKNLNRDGEHVWTPFLERKMLEALVAYVPPAGSFRSMGRAVRYPQRNRQTSDYIYEVCGETRTPKQIGSRIQQLRDTCSGKDLMSILSPDQQCPKRYTGGRSHIRPSARGHKKKATRGKAASKSISPGASSSSLSDYAPSERVPSFTPDDCGPSPPETPTLSVIIDILPAAVCPSSADESPSSLLSSTLAASLENPAFHPSEARPIYTIDPSVAFISLEMIDAHASWVVYSSGESCPVHIELTPLVPSHQVDGGYQYFTGLVPTFWSTICESPDPTRYTIEQSIVQNVDAVSIYSATYTFRYPSPSPPPSGLGSSRSSSDSLFSTESETADYWALFSFQDSESTMIDSLCTSTSSESMYEPVRENWLNDLLYSDFCGMPYDAAAAAAMDPPQHYYDEFAGSSPTSSCFSSALSDYLL